jgi:hypothetical protein
MMINPLSCVLCVCVSLGLVSSASADLPQAPPPREIRSDGSREATPEAGPKENPLEVVERIVKNSKAVGDKLAQTDTGAETRGTQKTILKDIDSLIDRQENPPPSGGDSQDMDKNKNKDMSPKGENDPKGGNQPNGGNQPKGGNQQAHGGRKPRQGEKGGQSPPMQPGKQDPSASKPDMSTAKADPMIGGAKAAGGAPMGKVAAKPSLPIDDAVVKEVWGHLPDKLRQQVSQYYKEQFMPKYSELLKQYYSSLANAPQKP